MFALFKWLVRIVSGLLLFGLAVGTLAYYFASRSLPDYDETYAVEGISAPVEIVRSTENVPHIFGATDADVYFGLGLAHAQDRLWQMVMARRTVQGRLSEVFGAQTLKTDELMRRLDLYGAAVSSVAAARQRRRRRRPGRRSCPRWPGRGGCPCCGRARGRR